MNWIGDFSKIIFRWREFQNVVTGMGISAIPPPSLSSHKDQPDWWDVMSATFELARGMEHWAIRWPLKSNKKHAVTQRHSAWNESAWRLHRRLGAHRRFPVRGLHPFPFSAFVFFLLYFYRGKSPKKNARRIPKGNGEGSVPGDRSEASAAKIDWNRRGQVHLKFSKLGQGSEELLNQNSVTKIEFLPCWVLKIVAGAFY